MLAGVSATLRDQLIRTGAMAFIGQENVFLAQEQLGLSMNEAFMAARAWLEETQPQTGGPE